MLEPSVLVPDLCLCFEDLLELFECFDLLLCFVLSMELLEPWFAPELDPQVELDELFWLDESCVPIVEPCVPMSPVLRLLLPLLLLPLLQLESPELELPDEP